MSLTILELLYIVLIVFISVIWTLLAISLVKVIRILTVVDEITSYYTKIKSILSTYKNVPESIKDKIKSNFKNKKSD